MQAMSYARLWASDAEYERQLIAWLLAGIDDRRGRPPALLGSVRRGQTSALVRGARGNQRAWEAPKGSYLRGIILEEYGASES